MSLEEVRKLTLAQVQDVYFRARDKNGNIKRDPDKLPKATTPRDDFVEKWMGWGLTRERAAELWREKQAKAKKAKKAKKGKHGGKRSR